MSDQSPPRLLDPERLRECQPWVALPGAIRGD